MTDVEGAVLGCVAGYNNDPQVKLEVLSRDDFSSTHSKQCFDVLWNVAEINDGEIDIVLIGDYIRTKANELAKEQQDIPAAFLPVTWVELIDALPSSANFISYVERLKEARRSLDLKALLTNELANVNGHGNADVIERIQSGITGIYGGAQEYDHAAVVLDAVMELQDRQDKGIEITTGFRTFDDIWGGLIKKEMYVIAGDSGHFKTTLTLNLMRKPLKEGHRVLWIDGEMGQLRLIRHMIAIEAGIETWRLRKGVMRDKDWQLFTNASAQVQGWPLIILNDVTTLSKMNEVILKYQPEIVVLDNIQNMDFPKGSDSFWNFHMGIVGLKRMALTHDFAFVPLSQVTRTVADIRSLKPPTTENLFGSRSIKQNADAVTMVYWPWKDEQSNGSKKPERPHDEYFVYHMKMREEGLAQQVMTIDAEHGRVADRGYKKEEDVPIPEEQF